MGELQVEVEPGEVGLDEARLERLTTFLDRLRRGAGRIPGWLAVVTARGQGWPTWAGAAAHVEDDCPVETGHDLPRSTR